MRMKTFLPFGFLALLAVPLVADDLLSKAMGADSPLTKESISHRVRVTLLYVGPPKSSPLHEQQKLMAKPYVITYLVEDLRSDDELQRHPWKTAAGIDDNYFLRVVKPDIKDGSGRHLAAGTINQVPYDYATTPGFKTGYPGVRIPTTGHPDRIQVYEDFLDEAPQGPFDIVLHDCILAYGANDFHFRDIDVSSFSSN